MAISWSRVGPPATRLPLPAKLMRRAVRELAVFAFYTVIAVVLTWPLATNLRTAVSDLGDPLLNTWIVDWDHYALTHHPLRLFDASIFYPSKFPLAYSENLLGIALLTLPFYLLGCAPLTIYNIAVIIAFAFSAYGGFVLARMFVGRITPALAAGILYGFVPYKYLHLAHLQILWSAWLPLTLAALLLYRRVPTWCNATLLGGAFLFNGLTNIYYLLFASTALTATLVLFAIAEVRDAKFWLRMATTLLLAGVILLPILWPYHVVSDLYGLRRGEGETLGGSATPISWLVGPTNRFYGNLAADELQRPECALFPGALALFLLCAALLLTPRRSLTRASVIPRTLWWLDALIVLLAALTFVGIVTDQVRIVMFGHLLVKFDRSYFQATLLVMCILIRLAIRLPRGLGEGNLRTAVERSRFSIELWAAALWIGIGFIGSLGLNAFFYRFLFHNVSVFRALRAPARWAMIAYAGLVPWAAAGIAAFRPRRWLGPLFLVLALVDVWPRLRWEHAVVAPSEVDLWIAREHTGALFFLPVDRLDLVYQYEFRATRHHQPIFNGLSGFEPPLHRALRERPLDEKTLALLEQNGCRFVVVRPEWCGWEMISVIAWLRSAIAQGRLAFVRRFEFNI